MVTDTEKEKLALAIARSMLGWNEDTTEPERPGWSEAARKASEQTWVRINESCLSQARNYVEIITANGWEPKTTVEEVV